MKLQEAVSILEQWAPLDLAASWDNVGLLAGDRNADLCRVHFTIDLTPAVATEAIERGAGLVVAYHPPIFTGLKRLKSGDPVTECIRRDVALWSPHTALDAAIGGTNDFLADVLEVAAREPLEPSVRADRPGVGLGRIGTIARCDRMEVVERVKRGLGLEHVLVAGPRSGPAERVAVCAGSCGKHVELAIARGADVYVTGELGHHDALAAARANVTVIATLHSNSERLAVADLAKRFRAQCPDLEVVTSALDVDPFKVL